MLLKMLVGSSHRIAFVTVPVAVVAGRARLQWL
jgi:hypothetical protein